MTGFAEALYKDLPFPVLIVDGAALVVSYNDAAGRTFGWNRDGKRPSAHAIIADPGASEALARQASRGRENAHPFTFLHVNGNTFDATAHVLALPEEGGAVRYAILLRSLLSGGSHGEQVLLGERINAALDTMPEGFAIFDQEERLLMFNRAFRDRAGVVRDLIRIGVTLETVVRAAVERGYYNGIESGTPEAEAIVQRRLEDHRNPDSTGMIFRFNDRWMRSESHLTESGDIVGLRIDVTELKEAEQALEEKRREYFSLLQILPDMIVRFDRGLVMRFVNDRFAAFFNSTAERLTGLSVYDLGPPPDGASTFLDIDSYTPEAPVKTREIRYTGPDGEAIWAHWTAIATFEDGQADEFVAVGRDITEAKRQQAQVEAQTSELRRKNEALDQFTATVSHDLKAPLRHLSMFAEMISEDLHRGEIGELPVYADHVRKSAARMRRIIDSLLEFSQIAYRIATPKPVSLTDVVREGLTLLESHVSETGGKIEVSDLPEVMGDPELLKRLAQNLIGNALKYRRPGETPHVRVYGRYGEETVDLVVEDDGIGIDPQHVDRIFEVFQRLHRDESVYQGTGVGLALARRIVESHNGVIALDTTYGPGARFVVTFPHAANMKERHWPAQPES